MLQEGSTCCTCVFLKEIKFAPGARDGWVVSVQKVVLTMLHYEESGRGVPLLLLHAFPLTSETFWPLLEMPVDGVRVIAPDFRGFGKSSGLQGTLTMQSMANDVLELMTGLGLTSAYVGGVSMGGYVAMALLRQDPGRVRGLLLCDTQMGDDDEAGKAKRETTAKDLEANGMKPLVQAMLPKFFTTKASASAVERVKQMMLSANPSAAAAATRGMALREQSKDILARFGGPAMIVVGAHDAITGPEKAKAMADVISDSTLEVIEGAAHLANLEQPEAFRSAVARLAGGQKGDRSTRLG